MCRKFRLLPIYALIASALLFGGCRNPKVSSLAEQVSFRVAPVNDFISLWRGEEDSYEKDDELTLWLLEHFNTKRQNPATEYERFQCLKDCIERLFDYEPETQIELNDWSSLRRRLQEFYARILLKETIKRSDKVVASALKKEEAAWLKYHSALASAYRIIYKEMRSSWDMSMAEIREDDALARAVSLEDYYFPVFDTPVQNDVLNGRHFSPEKHPVFDEKAVEKEYHQFMNSFKENEDSYPVSERKKALNKEMWSWRRWMKARGDVSALLNGAAKDFYDNATNNLRRRKLIMLKNRYEGYGVTSAFLKSCLLPYDCDDSEIAGFSFERNFESY